jgi:hypothetical protein
MYLCQLLLQKFSPGLTAYQVLSKVLRLDSDSLGLVPEIVAGKIHCIAFLAHGTTLRLANERPNQAI